MRKMRVALVILLFLAVIMISQMGFALTAITPQSLGDSIGVANTRATLQGIQQQLASGNSNIAATSQALNAYANNMASQSMANATTNTNMANMAGAYHSALASGIGVPLSGIGDAIQELGSIHVGFSSPASVLQNMQIPRLAVLN
jgi:hypothetical protein